MQDTKELKAIKDITVSQIEGIALCLLTFGTEIVINDGTFYMITNR